MKEKSMRHIKLSEEVWQKIAERGQFGETEDDVLRRVFDLPQLAAEERHQRRRGGGHRGRDVWDEHEDDMGQLASLSGSGSPSRSNSGGYSGTSPRMHGLPMSPMRSPPSY